MEPLAFYPLLLVYYFIYRYQNEIFISYPLLYWINNRMNYLLDMNVYLWTIELNHRVNYIPIINMHFILPINFIGEMSLSWQLCNFLHTLWWLISFRSKMPVNLIDVNTLRPRQNGRHFADDIFKCIFLNENVWISIKISLKFVPKGPINNIPSLVQVMAWRRPGDKPLSEPMMVRLSTHICVTWPQWVKSYWFRYWLDVTMQ